MAYNGAKGALALVAGAALLTGGLEKAVAECRDWGEFKTPEALSQQLQRDHRKYDMIGGDECLDPERLALGYERLSDLFLGAGNLEQGLEYARTASELDPQNIGAYINQSGVLLNKNEVQKAMDLLKKAHKLDPNNWMVYSGFGVAFFKQGDVDRSYRAFSKSLSINPDSEGGKAWIKHLEDNFPGRFPTD